MGSDQYYEWINSMGEHVEAEWLHLKDNDISAYQYLASQSTHFCFEILNVDSMAEFLDYMGIDDEERKEIQSM